MERLERMSIEFTFVVKNSFLKEEADLISTGDEIVSISLQVKRLTSVSCCSRQWLHYREEIFYCSIVYYLI